jgi:acetyltransferase-like isoleucine patch superfamily enzyme
LRKDHRPYIVKRAWLKFQKFYTNRFIRPQLESLGKGFAFMKPWNVRLFGAPIEIGDYATVIAAPDNKIRLSVWPESEGRGRIKVGCYSLICPGVRIGSANAVTIGDNCMIASNVYISDSDWHDIYNRVSMGTTAPVNIEENVWIGDSAIICKGVTIGENSIIGAGAVVSRDIPDNTIAAGNPAKVVKVLDPAERMTKRDHWFSDPARLAREFDILDRALLKDNTLWHWLRYLISPGKDD